MNNPSPQTNTLGQRIHEARRGKRWSLAILAEKVGVSKVTVWAWEQGRMHPKVSRHQSIVDALGIPVDEILDAAQTATLDQQNVLLECQIRLGEAFGVDASQVKIKIHL